MNFGALLQIIPGLLNLVSNLFANRKKPPRRADDILGKANEKTDSQKAKDKADAAAREKFN
jgi:hypothetical protein